MGTGARMLRTFVGCCAWLLYGLSAAAALPVPTEGPFSTGTALPSAAESQAPRALVLGTAETSTAAPLPLTTAADTGFAASLADGLLSGGPTSPALPIGAELSDAATAASEYGPLAATTASGYSPRSAAGSDAEAAPSPPEPGETQVSAGDSQALTNATRSVNVSQENDAPAAEAASFSTREPLSFSSAEPNTTGAAPDTSFGTTLASPRFVDEGKNMSASVTREGAEGLQPIADTTPGPGFPSPSASGTQPTSRATGYPAANSPLGPGITTPPSRGLDMATTGVSKEGVTLPAGFQSGASSPSLSPNPEKLLATRQDEQASEATHVTQEPAGETAPAAEEGPALLEAGNAGDATSDATGAPDLPHPSLGSETVSGAVGNPGETSHLAGKTEPSLDTSPGPDRLEQGFPGVDLDNPSSAPPPAASEVLAAPAEPDVRGVPTSPATAALPEHTVPLPAEAAAAVEPSLLPVPWDAAAGGVPAPADIPDGSSSSPTSSSTADYAQPAPGAVASSLSGADDGAEVLASPNLSAPVPLSPGESELQGTAAGDSVGAGLSSDDGPGAGLNPALGDPSLASPGPTSPVLGDWLGPEQPVVVASEAGTMEQALGGGGSTARGELSPSSAPVSETGIDQATGSPSDPASSSDVAAASSIPETDGAGPIPEAAPGPDSLSQASLASEDVPDLTAAPADSPLPAPGAAASTLSGGDNGAETPAGPNLGPEPLSLGGSEPQGTVSGSPEGAGSLLAHGSGTSSNPALDASSSAAFGAEGRELPGASLGLPAEEGSEAAAAEQELGGGGSAAGAASSSGFIPGSETAFGIVDTGSPSGPSSSVDVAAASAISEPDGAGLIPEVAPGPDGLSQASLASNNVPDLAAAPADSPLPAPGAAASTLPGGDNGAETSAGPNLGPERLSLGGSEPQGTVSGSPEGAGSLLAHGSGTSSNPALDASSSAAFGAEGRELPGASLGLPAEEGSEAAAAEQELGGGGSAAGAASSSAFIPGSETAFGIVDTGSPSGPSSPIDVAAASAVSEPDGAGPIPEAAPGAGGLSQASLASEGGPHLAAALGAETAGDVAGTEVGNPVSTSPDMDMNAPEFSPQQDPAILGELPAGEAGGLTDSELSPPPLTSGAGEATALGEPSLPGPVAPGSAGLDPDLGTDAVRGDSPGQSPSAFDSAQRALSAAASTLPGDDNGAETPAGPSLRPEPLSLGGSEPQGTVSGSPEGAGSLLAHGSGTSSNPALDASSSAAFGAEGRELPGASLGLPAEEGSETAAAEQELGGGGSAAGAASSSAFIPGSETAFGIVDTGSPSGPSSPIDVAAASAISEPDGAGPIPEVAPGAGGLSQGSLASEGGPHLAAAPADSPLAAPGPAASTLPGGDNGAETSAGSNLSSALVPSLEGSEPQRKVGSTSYGSDLPGSALNPALEVPSPASSSLGGAVLSVPQGSPGGGPGLTAVEGSEASTAEQILGGGGSTAGAEQPPSSALGTSKVTGTDQLPDAGSPSGSASASDVAAAPSVWDTASVSSLRGAPSAPGLSQPSSGGAPASGGAQPELPPATGEADELAKAVPGERASPGQSQGSAVEGTSVSGAFDGAGSTVENSAPSALSVGGSSSLGTASTTTEQAGLPSVSGGAGGSNTAASGLGSSGNEGAPLSAPGIQSASGLGASEAKLSQASAVELPGGERGVSASNEASLSATLGARGIVQAAPGVLAPSALASSQQGQTLLPPALDAGVATAGIASLLGSSLLLPGHGLGASPASLEGARGSSGLVPKEKPPSPSSIRSGSSLAAAGAPLPAAKVLHGPLAGAETALPWSLEGETASGLPAPSGEGPPSALASPNAGPAVPPAAEGLSPGSRFSSPGSTSDLTAGPSVLEKGPLGVASAGPYGPALLLPAPHPKSPGVPFSSVAAEGRGDADSPGQPRPGLPGAVAGSGAAAQLPPRVAAAPPVQSSIVQSSTGGSSGLAPVRIAAGNPLTKFPGAGSAGGSSPVVPQPPSSSKVIAGLSNGASAGPAAAASSVHGPVPGQGAARGGTPVTTHPPVSCSPEATAPTSQASLRKVLPEPGANGAAALPPQGSSNAFPAPMARPVAPAAPLPVTAAVPLYAYGTRENDREYVERRVDFNSPLFKPETGFPFGKGLRNSLYFTDNGQIIFPTSDKNIFSYPNPPPGGFNGREKVPMIAVFWDDADFSRGVGTIFYQEFLTLNTAKPPFIQDVEAKIQRYMKSSYSAVWTLKITWVKAPAHTARTDTRRTSTYQAVLTTDGFRSYLLILYQDGGMGWDYSQLSATNVLIGYSSGDGFYHNDDLTQRPPAAKYRPDQFKGSNTDLRGLWIYKLESRVGPNFRLKCLAWTGREQDPRVWSQGLPSCPCSLQEGQRDSHFRSARRGRLNNSPLTMLHSASPNQRGAGVRCLYDSQGRFTEGRQERYWRPFRQASPYRDQELKLHHWCCNHPGSPKLCARYSEKRPEIGCGGHRVPSTGWFPARLPWRSSEEKDSDSEEREDDDEE